MARHPKTTEASALAHMQRAIQLARRGAGWVQSNPMVGSVFVDAAGTVLAESYHAKFGGAHAERRVLERVMQHYPKNQIRRGTLYITLEPCGHSGKTPPCLDLILQSGVQHVVIGSVDPNGLVNGKSIRRLRRAGVKVEVGVAQVECDYLIRAFRKWVITKQPFILAKVGMSLDGKITSSGAYHYITNDLALRRVHELRQELDVIMVGVNTIINDNPRLNTRLPGVKHIHHPLKVILDSRLRTPPHSKALDSNTLVACLESAPRHRMQAIARTGAEIFVVPPNRLRGKMLFEQLNMMALLAELGARGYTSILLEGGSYVFTTFINLQAIDEFHVFLAPYLFGASKLPFTYALQYDVSFPHPTFEQVGNNMLMRGYAKYTKAR
ncbi:MAG: bifunctional diaminohydroxyphosphoribosylaminopyrimidine deaminase/5-amino-6-(5-phosphoribosylamino)uracil reductase RibD [Candidatus Kerfeldbacteria bacterium]|nr:bifunctional diaminohydroxyphosphoribosylaminopyrimidine deaminase/5-amino-6-(5-phosphoribosylamino)uracil reductase RibD [Candidatus Kerfeldbacteria bacterium]